MEGTPTSSFRSKSRRTVLIVTILIVGVGVWSRTRSSSVFAWQTLPQGAEVRLLKVEKTVPGQLHKTTVGSSFFHSFRRFIPASVQTRWPNLIPPPPITATYQSKHDGVVLWFTTRGSFFFDRCCVIYPDGQKFRQYFSFSGSNGAASLYTSVLNTFPRTKDEFVLRLESPDLSSHLEFQIPNPNKLTAGKNWKAGPLSQTQTVDQTEVSIDLRASLTKIDYYNNPYYFSPWWVGTTVSLKPLKRGRYRNIRSQVWITDPEGHRTENTGIFSQPAWEVTVRCSFEDQDFLNGLPQEIYAKFYVKPPPPPTDFEDPFRESFNQSKPRYDHLFINTWKGTPTPSGKRPRSPWIW